MTDKSDFTTYQQTLYHTHNVIIFLDFSAIIYIRLRAGVAYNFTLTLRLLI